MDPMESMDRPRVTVLPGNRLSRRDAAVYLGRKPQTLAFWAMEGRGPAAVNIGGRAFYNLADLDAFIRSGNAEGEAA